MDMVFQSSNQLCAVLNPHLLFHLCFLAGSVVEAPSCEEDSEDEGHVHPHPAGGCLLWELCLLCCG